jgi:Voltage gated chloride channel
MTDPEILSTDAAPPTSTEPPNSSKLGSGSRAWLTGSWFTLSTTREERFFLALAVFIGVFSGLAVVCFRLAIDWTKIWLLGAMPEPHSWRLIAAPAVTSLVVAILVIHVFPLVRGSGVNQTKAALYIYNGYIPFRTALGKFITAALAIGSGSRLDPRIHRYRSEPAWRQRLAGGLIFLVNVYACWLP